MTPTERADLPRGWVLIENWIGKRAAWVTVEAVEEVTGRPWKEGECEFFNEEQSATLRLHPSRLEVPGRSYSARFRP